MNDIGLYGPKVTSDELPDLIENVFDLNEKQPDYDRACVCVWGHSGIGKTSILLDFANRRVVWEGEEYSGYSVKVVPLAEFEEMGDIIGWPERSIKMYRESSGLSMERPENVERFIPTSLIQHYIEDGWIVHEDYGSKMHYSIPSWVPTQPGPGILVLDDVNRASNRIVKGLMRFFQTFSTTSWGLPKGWNIVMTANPDEQDYQVTSLDPAVLSRMAHLTLEPDVNKWVNDWAIKDESIDRRGIAFLLQYREMFAMDGCSRTNPRNWARLFRSTQGMEVSRDMEMIARSFVDDHPVEALMSFMKNPNDLVNVALLITPNDLLHGDIKREACLSVLRKCMGSNPRLDVMSLVMDRLVDFVVGHEDVEADSAVASNFRQFISDDCVPDDILDSITKRVVDRMGQATASKWIMGDEKLSNRMRNLPNV